MPSEDILGLPSLKAPVRESKVRASAAFPQPSSCRRAFLPRWQIQLIRTLAGNSAQECVNFSLDFNHLFSLDEPLFQSGVPLLKARDFRGFRIGLWPSSGRQRPARRSLPMPA